MNIPQDPFMLLSWVNTQLRDNYSSIDDLCQSLGADRNAIDSILSQAGFEYNAAQNKYW